MRKYLVAFLLLFMFVAPAFGLDFFPANSAKVAWDAVEGADAYDIYMKTEADPTAVFIERVTTLTYTYTFDQDQSIVVGVQAIRIETLGEATTETKSVIAWSDKPEFCLDGATFGLFYFVAPINPIIRRE